MKIRLSIPLLGINWGQTANPYIVVPLEDNITVEQTECQNRKNGNVIEIPIDSQELSLLKQVLSKDAENINYLYSSLTGETSEKNCYVLSLPNEDIPYISVYGSALAVMAYKLAYRALGSKPSKGDIIEVLSYLWADKPFWLRLLYESVALSSLTGKTVLYRGPDESIILGKISIKKVTRKNYYNIITEELEPPGDPQVQSALAKLEGISVISASNVIASLQETRPEIHSLLSTHYKIDNAISYIVYGLEPLRSGCKYIQSLNGGLEEVCVE